MRVDKRDLLNALSASVKELQQGIDSHCCLVDSILEGQMDGDNSKPPLSLSAKRVRVLMLKNAIKEAIDVLEESRKAFKSKRLEILRKKLTQVLIDID